MLQWENWSHEFDDRMPIYKQIILRFYRAFVRGEIRPGDRVPSIREMSALLKVNTNTMQRVYQEMEREVLINSKRGTGFFITEDTSMIDKTRRELALSSLDAFVESMKALGYKTEEILHELTLYMKGDDKE